MRIRLAGLLRASRKQPKCKYSVWLDPILLVTQWISRGAPGWQQAMYINKASWLATKPSKNNFFLCWSTSECCCVTLFLLWYHPPFTHSVIGQGHHYPRATVMCYATRLCLPLERSRLENIKHLISTVILAAICTSHLSLNL